VKGVMTMALTKEEMDGIAAMSQEDRLRLLALIREARTLYGNKGLGMPASALKAMTDCVGDDLMRDIVQDLRTVPEPGFLPVGPAPSPEARRGPSKEIPLGPPSGVAHADRIAEAFAAIDRRDLEKRLRGG
jgi:hypothetical protein